MDYKKLAEKIKAYQESPEGIEANRKLAIKYQRENEWRKKNIRFY